MRKKKKVEIWKDGSGKEYRVVKRYRRKWCEPNEEIIETEDGLRYVICGDMATPLIDLTDGHKLSEEEKKILAKIRENAPHFPSDLED